MKMLIYLCAAILVVNASTPAHADGTEDRLSTRGIGDIRVGISAEELQSRFGATLESFNEEVTAEICAYWKVPAYPDLGFMVYNGRLARLEVFQSTYQTLSGAQIGMSEQEVFRMFGEKVKVERHPYSHPVGKYLVFKSSDKKYGMIMETINGKVESYRIGLWDAVQLIEGCS